MQFAAFFMSLINLARGALRSRAVRNPQRGRKIDIFASLTRNEETGENGIVSWVRGLVARLPGFISGLIRSAAQWLVSNVVPLIISTVSAVANFDWNQTDASIRERMHQNDLAIAAALGSAVGAGAAWLVPIGLAGAASLKFPVLGGKVVLALAEEANQEIRGQVRALVTTTRDALVQNTILSGFLSLRRMRLFGLAPVTEQKEPWTIAQAIENRIESIPNDWWRTFFESGYDQFLDSLTDAAYVVSYAIDDYFSAMKIANQAQFGSQRTVAIEPDNRTEERVVLHGPQQLVKQSIMTALATHQLVHNRDVGQIVGQPAEDWLRAGMQRRKLTIVFKSKEKPPWTAAAGQPAVREVSYTIPEPDLGLTWQKLKTAAKHYTWGKFRATANLDNGRQMAVHGATVLEAEHKLKDLIALGTGELLTLSTTEEKDRHPSLRKGAIEMYPAYATLLIRRSTAELTGTNDLSGNNYREETRRIELWPDSEPDNTPSLR